MIRSRSQYIGMDDRLLDMFRKSRSLYDCALFIQRQRYFKTKDSGKIKTYNYNALWSIVKNTTQYKNCGLDIGPRTMAIQQVVKAWKSFIKATMEYKKNPEKF